MLAGLIALVILGPGSISVDDKMGLEPSTAALGREPALAGR